MTEDLVILYSGGADSTLLLKMAQSMDRKVFALMIDYGQLHIRELEYAKNICKQENIEYTVVELKNYNVKSGLTTGEKGSYQGVHEMNVPARNTIMLSIAAGIAESKGSKEVWIGCDMSDFYGKFPDCVQSYIGEINNLFKIAFSYPIVVEAPLLGFKKEMILKMLETYGITEDKLFTGYREFA
jgi:7-cyano-7-deazaguanine synthase